MKRTAKHFARRGVTLLELIVASTMLAAVVGATTTVLRGAHAAWVDHESDLARTEALAHGVGQLRGAQHPDAVRRDARMGPRFRH